MSPLRLVQRYYPETEWAGYAAERMRERGAEAQ